MLKIVIVDDEQIVLSGLKKVLESSGEGWQVAAAANNGIEGINAARSIKPDVLITDIRMPGMSGLEMSRILKQEMPELIVFIFSGYAEFQLAQEAIEIGAYNYLLKPINYKDIYKVLLKAQESIEERKRQIARMRCGFSSIKSVNDPKRNHRTRIIKEVLKYVDENYANSISLKEASERVYLNINYLSEIFKTETGETFTEYLKKVRVSRAAELLERMDLKVYQVSEMVGYSDPRHFSQVFKELIGVSPKNYTGGK